MKNRYHQVMIHLKSLRWRQMRKPVTLQRMTLLGPQMSRMQKMSRPTADAHSNVHATNSVIILSPVFAYLMFNVIFMEQTGTLAL